MSSTATSRSSSTSPSTSARRRSSPWWVSPAPARPPSPARRRPAQGVDRRLAFEGNQLGHGSRKRSATDRKRIQYIFQNPYLSLNPRLTIEQIVKRPMELFGIASGKAGHRARRRAARPGRARARGAEVPGQPALRRRAPARRHRPRAGRRARRAGLRRDHLGARRVRAGLDRLAAGVVAGARAASACCSSRTTWRSCARSLPACRSSTPAASSRPAPVVEVMDSPEGGLHQAPAGEQSAHRLRSVQEQHPVSDRPRLSTLSFVDPQRDAPVDVRRDQGVATAAAATPVRPLRAEIPGAGRMRGLESWVAETHTTALLVLDGELGSGSVVHEWYAEGVTAESLLLGASMTKSVLAHLVGSRRARREPPPRRRRRPARARAGRTPATPRAPSSTC